MQWDRTLKASKRAGRAKSAKIGADQPAPRHPVEARIGVAGWAVPARYRTPGDSGASHLAQYSKFFNCVEVNSSFRHDHRVETYQRWAAAVPDTFTFAVKVSGVVTHDLQLIGVSRELQQFASGVSGLGTKLQVVLLQFPASVEFDARRMLGAVRRLQGHTAARIVCEPRNATWFTPRAERLLAKWTVTRVAAHPVLEGLPLAPGGDSTVAYFRLHGAPRMYYSSYEAPFLKCLAETIISRTKSSLATWVIFDNTAANAAWPNALEMVAQIFDRR